MTKIFNGIKTIEIRKTAPKCDLPIDVYVYCTKSKDFLLDQNADGTFFVWDKRSHHYIYAREGEPKEYYFEGKVVAKFTCNFIGELTNESIERMKDGSGDYILKDACLSYEELKEYAKGDVVKLWHISDLVIFDKPMELGDFKYEKKRQRLGPDYHWHVEKSGLVPVKRPPQSWQYVEVDASPADRGE